MATVAAPPQPIGPPAPLYRLTVGQYHGLIAAGVLGPDDRVELLEGWLVAKLPRNPPHDSTIPLVPNRILAPRLPQGWFARGQSAITTHDCEPEPDIAVVRGSERDFFSRHPGPADLAPIIEVADSSLATDRTVKSRIYASASIPLYLILNIPDSRVERFSDPEGHGLQARYRTSRVLSDADPVSLIVDGQDLGPVPARDLLP